MLWCALALLVSQPPQPCLGYAQRKKPPRTQPPTRPPLKRGDDALAPTRPDNPRTHGREVMPCNAVPRYVMICYDVQCEAVLCSDTLCYHVLLGESASLHDLSSDARVARGGRAARLGRYATSATVERSA